MVASIKIVATPQGVKVEGEGYTGPACSLGVAKVLQALDLSPAEAVNKPEFYLEQDLNQGQQAGQGQ
jgi:L-serine deaminase